MTTAADAVLTRDDRWSTLGTVVMAVVFACATIVLAAMEITRILTSDPVSLLVPFSGEPAQLPIGPGGEMREVLVESAVVDAPGIPGISYAALVAEVAVTALTILGVLACVAVLCINIARTRVFAHANTVSLTTAALVIAIGWGISTLLSAMAINGAFAAISDREYNNVLFEANLLPLAGVFVLGALAAAFKVGEKLTRDTEGLV